VTASVPSGPAAVRLPGQTEVPGNPSVRHRAKSVGERFWNHSSDNAFAAWEQLLDRIPKMDEAGYERLRPGRAAGRLDHRHGAALARRGAVGHAGGDLRSLAAAGRQLLATFGPTFASLALGTALTGFGPIRPRADRAFPLTGAEGDLCPDERGDHATASDRSYHYKPCWRRRRPAPSVRSNRRHPQLPTVITRRMTTTMSRHGRTNIARIDTMPTPSSSART
jgi:hypothetical protein